MAGLAWLLFYVFFKRRLQDRKIIARMPPSSEVWREMQYAALSILIFGAVGGVTWFVAVNGMTHIYFRISNHGWGWFWRAGSSSRYAVCCGWARDRGIASCAATAR